MIKKMVASKNAFLLVAESRFHPIFKWPLIIVMLTLIFMKKLDADAVAAQKSNFSE